MVAAYFIGELGYWLVGATTINLLHFRFVDWWTGASFRHRVIELIAVELDSCHERLDGMRKDVDDIKESQNKMIATFRTGRNLP
jgi:hypothetical protein